ncbi:MAG TPA: hypothetical protein VFN55_01885 [Solirubrobacteraceae bacterium]|nr:hypothetical protein [Solirubrobacteraceae bacterium]
MRRRGPAGHARAAVGLCALALGGCAGLGPVGTTTRRSPTPLQIAQRTHEYPSPPGRSSAGPGFGSAVLAVRAFATGYINWTANTISGRMRGLAALSSGQARSAMLLAAAETARDYELHRGGVANAGTVQAIAPQPGRTGTYVVVTLERTSATRSAAYQGLAPSWHVTLATVARRAGGWVVSGWQPES